jgi:hypothetical protein
MKPKVFAYSRLSLSSYTYQLIGVARFVQAKARMRKDPSAGSKTKHGAVCTVFRTENTL